MHKCEIDWSDQRSHPLVSSYLNTFGVALIRGFFPAGLVSDLDNFIRARFDEARSDDLVPSNPEDMWAHVLDESLFLRIFRHCRESGFTDEIELFLCDEAVSVIEATVSIRQVKPKAVTSESSGWHQDSASFHFAPRHRFVSCWCPLTEAGESAPGLSLITKRLHSLAGPHDSSRGITVAELDTVANDWRDNVIKPNFMPGDIVVFDNLAAHGTYLSPSQTKTRRDIDFRFLQKRNLPMMPVGLRFLDGEFDKIQRTGLEFDLDPIKRLEMQAATIHNLTIELEGMRASQSWRVTKPLRKAKQLINRYLK